MDECTSLEFWRQTHGASWSGVSIMERHSYGDARSKLRSPTARDSPRKNEVPRANEHSVQSLEIGGQKWQKSIKWDRIRRIWIIFDVNPIEEVSGHSSRRVDKFNGHLHLLSSYSFSSTLLSSNLSLLSASSLLCFSSVHIVGSLTSKLPSIIYIYIYIYR